MFAKANIYLKKGLKFNTEYAKIRLRYEKSEGEKLKISYKKLWKLLIDKDLKKNDLRNLLSPATVNKLNHNKVVSLTVLMEICRFLSCDIGDIIELEL